MLLRTSEVTSVQMESLTFEAQAAKEGGIKWKSMSEEEKQQYIDRAAELKAEYEKAVESYNADKANKAKEIQDIEDDEEIQVKEVKKEVSDAE